jgi:predicted nucleotidyltransferase
MMRTALDHLPGAKQRELAHVVRVLFEEFQTATALGTQPWKKRARILKVILYGSYARGDWVDDPVGGYKSDYDILVVVNDAKLTDPVELWAVADDRLTRDATISGALSAPVNFIVHDLADLNGQLSHGRPFFVDIARQGIALYEAEGFELAEPRILPPEEARRRRSSISSAGSQVPRHSCEWRRAPVWLAIETRPLSYYTKLPSVFTIACCWS